MKIQSNCDSSTVEFNALKHKTEKWCVLALPPFFLTHQPRLRVLQILLTCLVYSTTTLFSINE